MAESRAAIAHEAGQPLSIETIQVDGPRGGEVMVEIKATGAATPMLLRYLVRIRKVCSHLFSATKVPGLWWTPGLE